MYISDRLRPRALDIIKVRKEACSQRCMQNPRHNLDTNCAPNKTTESPVSKEKYFSVLMNKHTLIVSHPPAKARCFLACDLVRKNPRTRVPVAIACDSEGARAPAAIADGSMGLFWVGVGSASQPTCQTHFLVNRRFCSGGQQRLPCHQHRQHERAFRRRS